MYINTYEHTDIWLRNLDHEEIEEELPRREVAPRDLEV